MVTETEIEVEKEEGKSEGNTGKGGEPQSEGRLAKE